ncbi:CAAX prenyl protease [Purpureocillium takamizusanense]|uniref:intramembrane prenyl-peptidase Rce1 n=1 Tax=Purpureocillium takamizusanense TaxID=2060973 RepID=A0A9Q8QCE7_9HYPO|nr:CAAX prenyl protease [Purpureocillium takamizusanense]UNI16252.1 CAAX prenyl protease [Purpureocillium takamizusanense]
MGPILTLTDPPPLGKPQAFGLLVVYSVVYVLPLHLRTATRASASRSRDAPDAIRARIRSVSFSTTTCSLATLFIILDSTSRPPSETLLGHLTLAFHFMGYWPVGYMETIKSLCLTALLFAAPLYECLLVDGLWMQWRQLEPLRHVWSEWPVWRNMVAGPVTEECLFRSAAVPLLLLAGSDMSSIIFLSPVVFGLAHVHHFYEFRVTHPETPLAVAVARSVLQFSYTSIFGAYATFIYLRTGSLLAAVAVHALCNSIGLPRIWGPVEPYWLRTHDSKQALRLLPWTMLYYSLLLGGCFLWRSNLYSLTSSPSALTAI